MARSVQGSCASDFVRQLAAGIVLLSGISLGAQSYQSSFSEVKYDRAKTPVGWHGVAEVDVPSGAVNLSIPLGPGIGARGAEFRPRLTGRSGTSTRTVGNAFYWTYNFIDPTRAVWVQEMSKLTLNLPTEGLAIGPGGLVLPVKGMYARNFHAVRWTGPDGGTGTGSRLLEQDPANNGQPLASLDFLALLKFFGFGEGWELCRSEFGGCIGQSFASTGTQGELIFPITHPTFAPKVTLPAARIYGHDAYTENGQIWPEVHPFPAIVLIKGDVLYHYEFWEASYFPTAGSGFTPDTLTVNGIHANPKTYREFPDAYYDSTGRLQLEDLENLHYRLKRIVNKVGDEVLFSYSIGSYTATWKVSGVESGAITQTYTSPEGSGVSTLTYNVPGQTQSYEIQYGGKQAQTDYLYGNWMESKRGAIYRPSSNEWIEETPRRDPEFPLQFPMVQSVKCVETQEQIELKYQDMGPSEIGTIPRIVPEGYSEKIACGPQAFVIKEISTPGKTTSFQWQSFSFRRNDASSAYPDSKFMGYTADINRKCDFFSAVSEVKEISDASVRTTKYTRTVPNPIPPEYCPPNQWASTTFNTVITHPDTSVSVHRFVSPLNNGRAGSPFDGSSPDEIMQTLAHLKHLVAEIREYPAGTTGCVEDLSNPPDRSSAFRITVFDRWDVRSLGRPAGDLLNGSAPYPTRTRTWSKDTGVVEETEMFDWDGTNRGWKTNRKLIRSLTETDLSAIEYRSLALQNLSTPSYPAPKAGREETRTLSSSLAEWTWELPMTKQSTAYDGTNTLVLPGVSNSWESKEGLSRLSKVDVTVASNPALSTIFTYLGDSGKTKAQRKDAILSGPGLKLSNGAGVATFEYDTLGSLNRIQPKGVDWDLLQTNDAFGRATSQTRADGLSVGIEWGPGGRLKRIVPPGNEMPTEYKYDPDFLGVTIMRGDQENHIRYNGFGELVRETNKNASGALRSRTFGYDSGGRRTWESVWKGEEGVDSNWSASPESFDTPDLLKTICAEWEPTPNGDPHCIEWTTVTFPGSYSKQISRTYYDNRGRPWRVINPNGQVVDTIYDMGPVGGGVGLVTKKTAYTGVVNRLDSSPTGPLTTTYERDVMGRLVKVTDALNQVTEYCYDPEDRIKKVIQWAGAAGTSAKQERTWTYDDLRRLIVITQPESGTTSYSDFDVNGKPWTVSYNGKIVQSTFDGTGRLKTLKADDGSVDQTFLYDQGGKEARANGKLTTASASGGTRVLGYDLDHGRLKTLTRSLDSEMFLQTFSYDAYGRVKGRTYPDAKQQDVHYQDATDLPDWMNFNGIRLANLEYDPTSWNLKTLAYSGPANGASTAFLYGWDQIRLQSLTNNIPSRTFTKVWSYSYDGAGRLLTDGEDAFTYDPLGRLKTAAVADPWTSKGLFQAFSYDAFGNRIQSSTQSVLNWVPPAALPTTLNVSTTLRADLKTPITSTAFSLADSALLKNQLPAYMSNGAPTGVTYDAQGNLTQVNKTPGSTAAWVKLTYDALGRVSRLEDHDPNHLVNEDYLHDDEGLRIRVWDGTKYRYNIYNEARQLIAQYEKVGTGPLTWKKDIVYVGTKEIAEVNSDGKTYITMCDHLGSPRFIWSGGSDAVIKQKFLPFGEQLTDPTSMGKVSKGFTNHEQTDASGLIYMQARFYLPMWGRFTSPDPARDQHFEETQSWNIYSYVQNNPVMNIDPTGMITEGNWNFGGWLMSKVKSLFSSRSSAVSSGGGTVRFRNREYKSRDLEVHSIKSGTVVEAKDRKGYGPQVIVASDDSNGKSGDRYAHLNPQMPKEGTHVNAGDVIGSVAATDPLPGRNTGPHLHHEVIPDLTKPGETIKPDSGDAKKALPSSGGRSSGYGERKDPINPSKKQFHRGEDITPPYKVVK